MTKSRRPSEAQFKRKGEALFLKANPGATIGEWTFFSTGFTWANGTKGVSGRFTASQPGYRTKSVLVTWMGGGPVGGWSVR